MLTGLALTTIPAGAAEQEADISPRFEDATFADPTTIDNPFLPLVPGTKLVLVGTAHRGQGMRAHRVVQIVTPVTKEVAGLRTLVVWDRDFQDGELVESEISFWAQDDAGNVWNVGEYPEEWEDGVLIGAPTTWLNGTQRARAGVHMLADPQPGGGSYLQGRAPAVEFLDRARVKAADQRTCVPTGCYRGVLVTDEWAPLEQPEDGHQLKYHAPGVGIVRVEAVGGEEQETLVLAKHEQLSRAELNEAIAKVLHLDQRAYVLAKDVWRGTAPAQVGL
jgi:uncharacterized protein YbaA (DUF1428 family)